VANQLRAHLKIVFPGAVGLFADLDSPISLAFLSRFDCQDRAGWLSVKRLTAWLASVGYSGRTHPRELYRRLTTAPRGTTGTDGTATTGAFVAVLSSLAAQIKALDAEIAEQLARHVDAPIFTSLPRSGTFRAARLLGEIGNCRARFPTPESLACLAGVAPSTRQSGKVKHVGFRWAADKQLREAVTDFAGDSRRANPWAADLYNRARARGHDHPHAVRILVLAWLYVIWHCWQDGVAYDPAKHRALQTLLNQDQHRAQGNSCVRLPCVERPGRTHVVGGEVDIGCANRHSDLHVRGVDVAQLAEHPHPSSSSTSAVTTQQRAPGHPQGMMHHEAEHRARAAGDGVVDRRLVVLPDRRHRWMLLAAVRPLRDPQFVRVDPVPEELVSRDERH
jgi:hypothetical protein